MYNSFQQKPSHIVFLINKSRLTHAHTQCSPLLELLLSLTLLKRNSDTSVLLLGNFEEHLRTASSQLTLESDQLELCFWTVFQNHPDSVILQKKPVAFKPELEAHLAEMLFLYLSPILSFEIRFRMIIINGYYTKSKRLQKQSP